MHQEQRRRARLEFEDRGFPHAVACNPAIVTWLTGIPFYSIAASNPFSGGPPVIWFEDGTFTLLIGNGFAQQAEEFAKEDGCQSVLYEGYTVEGPLIPHQNLAAEFGRLAMRTAGEIGVEVRELPAVLREQLPGEVIAIDGWSVPLRKTKTRGELAKLRENFRLSDMGQKMARETVQVGVTEMDIYLVAYGAIQKEAGELVPVGNDFVSCSRRNNIGGTPMNRKLQEGDSMIVDISTVLEGYWSDSCATYYVSEPTKEQEKAHRTIAHALQAGIEKMQPGTRACDVDLAMRRVIREAGYPEYPHHGGHGVGVTGHEAPRICSYNQELLEENMVVMLEPGIYVPEQSAVRLEHGVLITADGPALLTAHSID